MSIRRTYVVETENTQLPSKEINKINIAVDLTEATLKSTIEAEYNRIYRQLIELKILSKTSRFVGTENLPDVERYTIEVEADIAEIYSRLKCLRDNLERLESAIAKSK